MKPRQPIKRDPAAGLTLIEMLIVLVIIGVGTSAAVLSTGFAGRDQRAENEAVRLAALLETAVDEGLVSRRKLALFWDERGYVFRGWNAGGWQVMAVPQLARDHDLPEGMELRRLDGDTGPVVVAEDGLGPPALLQIEGAGAPWAVAFDGFTAQARRGAAP